MTYKSVLVPIEFSGISGEVLKKADELKRETGCSIVLAHVIDYMPPSHVWVELPNMYTSETQMVKRAENQMLELIEKTALASCEMVVKVGNPKDLILKIQHEQGADLILMAKHNQKGLERLLGSTTNSIVQRAKCDVLVLHE